MRLVLLALAAVTAAFPLPQTFPGRGYPDSGLVTRSSPGVEHVVHQPDEQQPGFPTPSSPSSSSQVPSLRDSSSHTPPGSNALPRNPNIVPDPQLATDNHPLANHNDIQPKVSSPPRRPYGATIMSKTTQARARRLSGERSETIPNTRGTNLGKDSPVQFTSFGAAGHILSTADDPSALAALEPPVVNIKNPRSKPRTKHKSRGEETTAKTKKPSRRRGRNLDTFNPPPGPGVQPKAPWTGEFPSDDATADELEKRPVSAAEGVRR